MGRDKVKERGKGMSDGIGERWEETTTFAGVLFLCRFIFLSGRYSGPIAAPIYVYESFNSYLLDAYHPTRAS